MDGKDLDNYKTYHDNLSDSENKEGYKNSKDKDEKKNTLLFEEDFIYPITNIANEALIVSENNQKKNT